MDVNFRQERSYLSSAVDSLNPWASTSRSATPTPKPTAVAANGDHSTTHLYGQSIKSYPRDCPPLRVLWFHAIDTPKRKPAVHVSKTGDEKPLPAPKKFTAFSLSDSRSVEKSYQALLEHAERCRVDPEPKDGPSSSVAVQEDYLFDVDIRSRELKPVYWLGPVYEVRRGTWFYQEGSTLRPCDENLASQLEEGFLKVRPWKYPKMHEADPKKDASFKDGAPSATDQNRQTAFDPQGLPRSMEGQPSAAPCMAEPRQPHSYRLFGSYMNSVATYQDEMTAWLSSDSVLSWVTSTVYQRFSGGTGYMGGIKLVRGWSDSAITPRSMECKANGENTPHLAADQPRATRQSEHVLPKEAYPGGASNSPPASDSAAKENDAEYQFETELEDDDFRPEEGESQGREIDHVILVTHGIGQLLSSRMESMNFVHDVNILRKTMKTTYTNSADLCALNLENGDGPKNCRVQVLPVCWRHLLQFPKKREKVREQDLGDMASDDDEYPTLEDITIEGMAFARSLISDLALDVLLYQSAYRQSISTIVLTEANRIHRLFRDRNPAFAGKVHIIGHSLGSAVMFDILCRQKEMDVSGGVQRNPLGFWPAQPVDSASEVMDAKDLQFDFTVDDFYCLGSPVGLFQMLKGRTIAGRHCRSIPSESPFEEDLDEDPFVTGRAYRGQHVSSATGLPVSVSSPKVAQLFNIFHPSDPVSYRLEPLISTSLSGLKPQSLPYTKKNIFSNVTQQSLTGIGARVGQSMTGLWTSLSAGITSNLLSRNLSLTNDDIARLGSSPGSGEPPDDIASKVDGSIVPGASHIGERTNERKKQLARTSTDGSCTSISGNDITLIDDELETLVSRFQGGGVKLPGSPSNGAPRSAPVDESLKRHVEREDAKIRALNRNGRVDYSIQESVLDFNPINTIASHMSYWADEDVSHFILSQLLSDGRRKRKVATTSLPPMSPT